jgi:hypothetical protein
LYCLCRPRLLVRPGVPGQTFKSKQSKAKGSHILRPGNTVFKEQLKLVNGFVLKNKNKIGAVYVYDFKPDFL